MAEDSIGLPSLLDSLSDVPLENFPMSPGCLEFLDQLGVPLGDPAASMLHSGQEWATNHTGASSGAILNQRSTGNTDFSPQAPNTSNSRVSRQLLSEEEKRKRKKETDLRYRTKIKKKKEQMESELKKLRGENRSLLQATASVDQSSTNQLNTIHQLRSDLSLVMQNIAELNAKVEAFALGNAAGPSEKISQLQEENAKLQEKISQLQEENAKLQKVKDLDAELPCD